MEAEWRDGTVDRFSHCPRFQPCGTTCPGALRALGGLGAGTCEDDLEDDDSDKNLKILIFTSSGNKLSEVTLDEGTVLAGVGWNDQEQLVVIEEYGSSHIFDIWGRLISEFQMGGVENRVHLLECHFWGDGVVAMGADMNLYVAEKYAVSGQFSPLRANDSSSTGNVHTYVMATNINPEQGYASMTIASFCLEVGPIGSYCRHK